MSARPAELPSDELWNPLDPQQLEFETTESLPSEIDVIGQERAVQAVDFGISVAGYGFNIYALGNTGTGRSTTLRTFLDRAAAEQPVPNDWVYVYNFEDPKRPNAISLPPGVAVQLRSDMQELVNDLLRDIPRAFESEDYEKQRETIIRTMQEQRSQDFAQLELRVNERGFTLLKTAMGLGIAPVLNGQVLTPEAYQQLDEETRGQIEERQQTLQREMAETMRSIRDLEKTTKRQLSEFDREIAGFAVSHLIEDLKSKYGQYKEMLEYLDAVQADIVDNVEGFKAQEEPAEGLAAAMRSGEHEALLKRYQINVVVDNSGRSGAPVIFEANPVYGNLLGRIEHRSEFGAMVTDFTMIRAGCLHRANGGYLVVEMRGLLANPLAWDGLKRSLKNRNIRTEEIGTQLQIVSTVTLEPEPIPLDMKVLLIGDPLTYYLLHEFDEDFRKLFKIKADFGTRFERCSDTCHDYAQFIAVRCHEEKLPHFEREAVARVVEFSSRLAGHKHKLSTRFGEIADLIREASYWARRHGGDTTTVDDVQKAIDQKRYRSNRAEEQIQEMIDEGSLRVDVEGEIVGQVNGLAVMALGDYSFGKPSRITVRTFTGRSGVVSVDREAKMSGRIYDKGVLTLTGYLGGKYALDAPLSLAASISFEQLYDEIEGDSASSTELYALLSSLSGLPIRQGIAVTGSVDQQGNIQPIGGVNEKIEGFFDTCRSHSLNGDQGVMIPVQNVVNLMLRADVRKAVEDGQFHVYAVRTIDEGIEILTGTPAGVVQEDGGYPKDSVHGRVKARLEQISEALKEAKTAVDQESNPDSGTEEDSGGAEPATED